PYHRPLEGSDMFEDGRASRPLERGVVHRGQYLDMDLMVTGLTRDEWMAFYKHSAELKDATAPKVDTGLNPDQLEAANKKVAFGSPRYDPPGFDATKFQSGTPHPGPAIYVTEFP